MKELSLNILDIVENSVKAGASLTEISITETADELVLSIKDDGCGMSEETIKAVIDPFYTTRKTRKVGLGIPLLKMAAEQTGGYIEISSKTKEESPTLHGTELKAHFYKNHLDFTPLGDVVSTVQTLVQGHPDTDFLYVHNADGKEVRVDTREMREILGDISLSSYEVISWLGDFLREQYESI